MAEYTKQYLTEAYVGIRDAILQARREDALQELKRDYPVLKGYGGDFTDLPRVKAFLLDTAYTEDRSELSEILKLADELEEEHIRNRPKDT